MSATLTIEPEFICDSDAAPSGPQRASRFTSSRGTRNTLMRSGKP